MGIESGSWHDRSMANESIPMSEQEKRAIVGVCVLAAFADGGQSEVERARIQQIVKGFSDEGLDAASVYQDVLGGRFWLETAAGQLHSAESRALAYEMAVCVCNADGVVDDAEQKFLADLHRALGLDASS